MSGSTFDSSVNADNLTVGQSLLLNGGALFKGDVILRGARIGDNLNLSASTFEQTIHADSVSVERNLLLRDGATIKGSVNLKSAKIGGQLEMNVSAIEGSVSAQAATIGQWMVLRGTRFAQPVDLVSVRIAGGLDLTGAVANRIDLTSAVIGDDLVLGDTGSQPQWRCAGGPTAGASDATAIAGTTWPLGERSWRTASCRADANQHVPALILRNTHAGALQDNARAWPPDLDLEGFTYNRFGGLNGSGAADMRQRSPKLWRDWLERDRTFSTQPYIQLANVLLASGRRATADSVLYFGRERERREAIDRGDWYVGTWLTFLWAIAGYGIGMYTFRVFYWVAGLTLLGTVMLLFAAKARRHGLVWCFGASLQRLLPLVDFNKNFRNFFDNPPPGISGETRNLNGFLAFFFSLLALAGWMLGVVLLAALINLTPKF